MADKISPKVIKLTGSDVVLTSHTISGCSCSRAGSLYVANLTIKLNSDVAAWSNIATLKNISMLTSTYIVGDASNSIKTFYVGTSGQIQCTSALSSGAVIKIAFALSLN